MKPKDVIVIISDSEDEEVVVVDGKRPGKEDVIEVAAAPETSTSSMLGINRAEMERERLARLKRSRPDDISESSGDSGPKPTKKEKLSIPYMAAQRSTSIPTSQTSILPSKEVHTSVPQVTSTGATGVQYPKGVVKKTFAAGMPRTSDDITIEEVLQKDTLKLAVLSAFQWDFMWLFGKLKVGTTKLILVVQAKSDEERAHFQDNLGMLPRSKVIFPDMDGQINCMHSKLQLLFHDTHARIAIPTANLVDYDWGEMGGVMENDESTAKDNKSQQTSFLKELIYFCKAKGIPDEILQQMEDKYDFSASKDIAFVHTIGGGHLGDAALRTGFCGLAAAVRNLGLRTKKPLEIDAVTSSIGALNKDFLLSIYRAVRGDDLLGRLKRKAALAKSKKRKKATEAQAADDEDTTDESEGDENEDDETLWEALQPRIRVYFPSKQTVASSKGGAPCGGTICFQSRWYDAPTFPRTLLRDCESVRKGLLMHNKMLFVTPVASDKGKVQAHPWTYIGSANLSESAWGKLSLSGMSPKLNCRNWECGVLIPSPGETKSNCTTPTSPFARHEVPLPMIIPGQRYDRGKRPWFFAETR